MTNQDLITSSLRLIGVLPAGQTPNPEELSDSRDVLNAMLAEWNTQGLQIFAIRHETFPLVAGTQSYTIGEGGVFDTERPVKIQSAGIVQSNGLRSPLELINSERWAGIPEKAVSAVQPLQLYNDNAYPLANLRLWPKPSGTPSLDLAMWQELKTFSSYAYTDLVIDGALNTKVSSAARPLTAADVGKYLNVTGGTGFTEQRVKILSVLAGVATCDKALGTVGSTGGSADLDEDFDFPPGYFKAIRYNLAVDLAPEFRRDVQPAVADIARQSKGELIALNVSNRAATEAPPTPPPAQ